MLHASHSTLDRTCSDSVVSLRTRRCRKSTSDLTDDGGAQAADTAAAVSQSATSAQHAGGGGGGGGGAAGGVKASASSECGTPVATSPCHHRRRGSSKVYTYIHVRSTGCTHHLQWVYILMHQRGWWGAIRCCAHLVVSN